jgi:hypothetical protein
MSLTPTNRMAQPEQRKQGRPAKETSDRQPSLEAVIDTTQRTVPPLIPPCCGVGNVPKLERWEVSGTNAGKASCICQACGARFYYEPARVRLK